MPAVIIKDLRKSYGDLKAVDGVSLEIEEKEVFGILGPNGAGKTTTMEMAETLREPDSGEVFVDGIDALKDPRAVKEIIGVQLQTTVFFDNLKVREAMSLFSSFYPHTLDLDYLIDLVDLKEKAETMVSDLSGGQHKRLSIALALINDPRIVFLDEPTTGLDPQARRRVWEIIEQLRGKDKTVIITTHYIEEAEYLCDRVAVMDHGKIIALGTPDELIDEYVSKSIISFRMRPELDDDTVLKVTGVESVHSHGQEYELTTATPQETLIGLFEMAYQQGVKADEINMKRANLEDVFLKITGRKIKV